MSSRMKEEEEKKEFSNWDLADVPMGQLQRSIHYRFPLPRPRLSFDGVISSLKLDSKEISSSSSGVDNSLQFRDNFRVEVIRLTKDDMEFDMIGIDASIANAFLRILISEEIELEAHAVKGMGKTHAKWSPVATAWYRMLPEVVLLEDIEDEVAEELKKKCPINVSDIEDIGNGKKRATVARPRSCTLCRECIRGGEEWEKRVALQRVKNHFIFTIESTGALPPEELFTEAVKVFGRQM